MSEQRGELRVLLPAVLTIALPTVAYFILRAAGVGAFWALSIAGGAAGLMTLVNTVRQRRFDVIGFLILIEVTTSLGLVFFTRNPRILLLRPSFYSAATGVYFLLTLAFGRPFTYEAAKPMVAQRGMAQLSAYQRTWENAAKFRALERKLTAAWGVGLLIEALLRSWIVFHYSVDRSVILSHVPGITVVVALVLLTRHLAPALRGMVQSELASPAK